jgi:uncharacterized protein YlzI (FlbEa/FlbD family)
VKQRCGKQRKRRKRRMSKFIQLTFLSGTKVYFNADVITQLQESEDGTCLFVIDSDESMTVQESVDEILAKIENEPTIAEIRAEIEKLKARIPECTIYGSNQIDGINMVLKHVLDKY